MPFAVGVGSAAVLTCNESCSERTSCCTQIGLGPLVATTTANSRQYWERFARHAGSQFRRTSCGGLTSRKCSARSASTSLRRGSLQAQRDRCTETGLGFLGRADYSASILFPALGNERRNHRT